MRNTENGRKELIITPSGVDFDISQDLASLKKNFAKDMHNMAIREDNATQGVPEKILGETKILNSNAIDTTYVCIGATFLAGYTVVIWCSTGSANTLFEVDGDVMVSTNKLQWSASRFLQIARNENSDNSLFVVCDFDDSPTATVHNPPYIFDLQDIILNYNSGTPTPKYFADFNPELYIGFLNISQDHPVFIDYTQPTAGGLISGQYSYSVRFSDDTGNKTNWSVATPLIPVIGKVGTGSAQYPNIKTYGAKSDVGIETENAIHLRLRITNTSNYKYIQIRRTSYIASKQMDALPDKIEYRTWTTDINGNLINIQGVGNNYQVLNIQDDNSITDWLTVTDVEDTVSNDTTFSAKSPRFFNNRLVYLNIIQQSLDLSNIGSDIFLSGKDGLGFSVMEKLGTKGFRDGYNQTYYKHLQSGEKYGWGVKFVGSTGTGSFVLPIVNSAISHSLNWNFTNFPVPNRRESFAVGSDALKYTYDIWKGACFCADTDSDAGASNYYTHEVFDLVDAVQKTDTTTKAGIDDVYTPAPMTPKSDLDTSVAGHDILINPTVFIAPDTSATHAYAPKGFAPNYYAQGLGFYGIDKTKLPDWVKAFSIVRTKRAGRVVAQGLGFYKIYEHNQSGNPQTGYTCKDKKKIVFYSPDTDDNSGIGLIQQLLNNPTGYQVQLVSPVGLFTEMYNGAIFISSNNHTDMISYARILYENGSINPTDTTSDIGNGDGYVSFGRWRNTALTQNGPYGVNPNQGAGSDKFIFNIASSGITQKTPATDNTGRNNYLEIELAEELYNFERVTNTSLSSIPESDLRPMNEPLYIINIIKLADVPNNNNVQDYVETGHLQKLSSIIGISQRVAQTFPLVDERWEDCIPNPYFNGGLVTLPVVTSIAENRYVFVDGKRWLNVTYITPADRDGILFSFNINGYYDDTDGNRCYGVYLNDNTNFALNQFQIIFSDTIKGSVFTFQSQFTIPVIGQKITVQYDNKIPIKVFAGDSIVGESLFSVLDRRTNYDGSTDNQFMLNYINSGGGYLSTFPLPYTGFIIDSGETNQIRILEDSSQGSGAIFYSGSNRTMPERIRQMMCMFTCESRINTALIFGDTFPDMNYVMRPMKWNNSDNASALMRLYPNYAIDYPLEGSDAREYFKYGGFHFNCPTISATPAPTIPAGINIGYGVNIDYAKQLIDKFNFSKPVFGFTEQLHFASMLIWTEKNLGQQDYPNLKTIYSTSQYQLDNTQGDGKYLFDNNTQKGDNLIALMDRGIALVITDKRTLSDLSGNSLAYLEAGSVFIGDEQWLTKSIGVPDETWRGIAEYNNMLFFTNRESAWKIEGLNIKDILREAKGGMYTKLYPALQSIGAGYTTPLTAVFDEKHKEYWVSIGQTTPTTIITIGNPSTYDTNNLTIDNKKVIQFNLSSSISTPRTVILPAYFATGYYLSIINNTWVSLILSDPTSSFSVTLLPTVGQDKCILLKTVNSWTATINKTNADNTQTYVYAENLQNWLGYFDYNFTKLLAVKKVDGTNSLSVLGLRNFESYELNKGANINGLPVLAEIAYNFAEEAGVTKELVAMTINSSDVPSQINLSAQYDKLPMAFQRYLKNYTNAYYFQVPRQRLSPFYRLQNKSFIFKVIYAGANPFSVSSVEIEYSTIK